MFLLTVVGCYCLSTSVHVCVGIAVTQRSHSIESTVGREFQIFVPGLLRRLTFNGDQCIIQFSRFLFIVVPSLIIPFVVCCQRKSKNIYVYTYIFIFTYIQINKININVTILNWQWTPSFNYRLLISFIRGNWFQIYVKHPSNELVNPS